MAAKKAAKQPQDKKQTRLEQVVQEAGELDQRRQAQIQNQVHSIDRLLINGSYDEEMAVLHQTLAETQVVLEQTRQRLEEVERALAGHLE